VGFGLYNERGEIEDSVHLRISCEYQDFLKEVARLSAFRAGFTKLAHMIILMSFH